MLNAQNNQNQNKGKGNENNENRGSNERGFASMDPKKREEAARKGGQHSRGGGRKSES